MIFHLDNIQYVASSRKIHSFAKQQQNKNMDIKTQCVTSLLVLVYVINMSRVAALSCPESKKQNCKPAEELSCQGGVTLDECGFCTICAKVVGERCGGPWNTEGQCDEGLECHKSKWQAVGVCRSLAAHLCGVRLTGRSGQFSSPGYDQGDDYPNNFQCDYSVTVAEGMAVQIVFERPFVVETSNNGRCYDEVKIYDGPTDTSTLLGAFCGRYISWAPMVPPSSSHQVLVRFTTDHMVSRRGFKATFSQVLPGRLPVYGRTWASGPRPRTMTGSLWPRSHTSLATRITAEGRQIREPENLNDVATV